MAKGRFQINNIDGLTKEQAIGRPLFDYSNIFIGNITNVDENYLYVDFEHNGDNDILIKIDNDNIIFYDEECSMEIRGD